MILRKKTNLNSGIFITNEQLEAYLNSSLQWELADYSTHYKEIANLKQMKEEQTLLFEYVYKLFYKKRVRINI